MESVIIGAVLTIAIAIFTSMYCLAQDVKSAIRDAAKTIADAIRDASDNADHTDHTDHIDHDTIGTHLRAHGYRDRAHAHRDDDDMYGDPDNNS